MAGKAHGDDETSIVDINVTPLVDVILVLLIVFMVTAQLMVPPTIPLQLPKASTGSKEKTPASFAISLKYEALTREPPIYLNGKIMTYPKLKEKILVALRAKKGLQVIIAADRRIRFGKVMTLLDWLRRLGVEDYAFNIDPEASPPV